jgi:hypothetical protein
MRGTLKIAYEMSAGARFRVIPAGCFYNYTFGHFLLTSLIRLAVMQSPHFRRGARAWQPGLCLPDLATEFFAGRDETPSAFGLLGEQIAAILGKKSPGHRYRIPYSIAGRLPFSIETGCLENQKNLDKSFIDKV